MHLKYISNVLLKMTSGGYDSGNSLVIIQFGGLGWCWNSGQSPDSLLRQTPKWLFTLAIQVVGATVPQGTQSLPLFVLLIYRQ